MRSGLVGRWAAVTGAVLLTTACTQASGMAGAQPPATGTPETPETTATTPAATPSAEQQAAEQPPKGDAPVKVPPPKLSKYTYTFPVKGCETTYQRKLLVLPKTTIWAPQGCAFVAPVGGVVDEVNAKNRWRPSTDEGPHREGRFVTIIGDDGVRYLGGHLDTIADGIRPGVRVKAGRLLGRVGRSGNARDTGSNLYFAISWKTGPAFWWVRRGMVEPWDYLDAWRTGNRSLSPREETLALRGRLGETPRCAVQCEAKKVPQTRRTRPAEEPRVDDDNGPVLTVNPSTAPFGRQ
ncbi:M23 family metallopeptidase [Nonomuraea sp. K274]|uniref:M23 family metallopeptidase n=1 Tax=Nonomuraea cypriaca TaxID=1187855 RepID=A0A931ADA0_9ACTN|nr:M23 family metallopeptidase [Nonomuraea cypriaca]MBF8188964.1 M23 family metallopeptidase [Nonomuraea cypriaca]